MKNIHIIPTDKPSRLAKSTKSGLNAAKKGEGLYESGRFGITNFNINITSDEEIEVGDWYINTFVSEIEQKPQTHTEKRHLINHQKDYRFKYCKKIILTTDQDLIKDGVQSIDDEFLEWFVQNPSCEEVKIDESTLLNTSRTFLGVEKYKIIIPKEEPKQETLEEAAKNYIYKPQNNDYGDYNSFIAGAKWQQERSYSEEEVMDMFHNLSMHLPLHYEFLVKEQFKNK